MYVSSWGRLVRRNNFREMAGIGKQIDVRNEEEQGYKSIKSQRTTWSQSTKNKTKSNGKWKKGKTSQNMAENAHEMDSRLKDFDDEDEVISLGSDASRIAKIDQEMEKLAPTWTKRYNEYKCKEGHQERLEDAPLPEDLDNDAVYEETLKLHQEQLVATENCTRRSKQRLELSEIRQKILDKREESQIAEAELEINAMKKQYKCRKMLLEKKKEKEDLQRLLQQQQQEIEETNLGQTQNNRSDYRQENDDYRLNRSHEQVQVATAQSGASKQRA